MITTVGREDLLATSVQTRESNGVFVRLGAAVGEEHLGRAVKGVVEDEFGRPVALGIAVLGRDRGQQLGLFGNRGDDFGVLMTDVHVHQLRGEVEVGVAILVGDVNALRVANHEWVDRSLCGPGVED